LRTASAARRPRLADQFGHLLDRPHVGGPRLHRDQQRVGDGQRRPQAAGVTTADADADRRRLEARMCAAGLVDHLYRCGIRWSRLPPAPPHRTS
jgi:hypothetical protein